MDCSSVRCQVWVNDQLTFSEGLRDFAGTWYGSVDLMALAEKAGKVVKSYSYGDGRKPDIVTTDVKGHMVKLYHDYATITRNTPSWVEFLSHILPNIPTTSEDLQATTWDSAVEAARKVGFDVEALKGLLNSTPIPVNYRPWDARRFYRDAINALQTGTKDATLAYMAGVENKSYSTVRWGTVASFEGEGVVTYPSGRKFRVYGTRPDGNIHMIFKEGEIVWKEIKA